MGRTLIALGGIFQGQVTPVADNSSAAFNVPTCDWKERAIKRLAELCALPQGWDGHNGKPANHDAVMFAANIIVGLMRPRVPMPSIMPLSYGGVQIEWHRNNWDVEIEVAAPNRMHVFGCNLASGREESLDLTNSLEPIGHLLEKILVP